MRIAVDARSLSGERTGVGRTLEGLYAAWMRLYPGDSVVLVSPRPLSVPVALKGRVEVRPPARPRLPGTLWLQAVAPIEAVRAGADLFHGPLGVLPLASPLPGVATIHDLTPLLFPEWHDRKNVAGFAPLLPGTVRRAARLVCVSRSTMADLLLACPEAGGKAFVVPNGLVPPPAVDAGPAPHPRPFVLSIGTFEPRKNHERLVLAMESIWDRRPHFPDLVLAGGSGWGLPGFVERLSRSRHADRISCPGWVAPERAAALLKGARLLAYPSLYEGFGLPALEAMAEGTPVVASSSSSLPEVVGDAGLLPDPLDVGAIASAIERANDDEAFRARARRRGPERAALFTWEEAARRTRALFVEALA
jgi:glycosyltransferase involved in cell wall biosynthesis